MDLWHRDPERISSTLVCDVYAISALFWHSSDALKKHTRPDLAYFWNQAVASLHDDFMAPTISTIHATVLDMLGRPVFGITGNVVKAGRISTLAASMGLHRNPTSWKCTTDEKSVRIRLWWGVRIIDHWYLMSSMT
jgi:hypothetical protein